MYIWTWIPIRFACVGRLFRVISSYAARLARHHDVPLPHHDVGGKVLVKRSEFDRWMEHSATSELIPPLVAAPTRAL